MTGPPYRIEVSSSADRDLVALEHGIAGRVDARIRSLAHDPRPPGHRKIRGGEKLYRVRVGDWRILYEIDDGRRAVTIARVRHRREVYRD